MKKILINFAHPSRTNSKINNAMRAAVESLEAVTVNDLYANYPDFLIDVKREQILCESNDVIIFQHPFYWYSTPSIMKEWLDVVLQQGWAYGGKGNALKGKLFIEALTGSSGEVTYRREGRSHFTIEELTSPYQAMAKRCKMIWLPPFTILGIHKGISEEKLAKHAENYRRFIIALRDEKLNIEEVKKNKYSNSDLDKDIRG